MLCYKYGSKSLSYQSESLICSQLEWIGIKPSQFKFFSNNAGLLPLTRRDRLKLISMAKRKLPLSEARLKKEMLDMLHLGYKSEIQLLNMTDLLLFIKTFT
jgi:DNA topoisomerase VI subunit A